MKRRQRSDEGSLGWSPAVVPCGVGALLIAECASEHSVLPALLSTSDLFTIRLTCKQAWQSITHATLHKGNIMSVAVDDGHVPTMLWALRNNAQVEAEHATRAAAVGSPVLTLELRKRFPHYAEFVMLGLAEGGHGDALRPLLPKSKADTYLAYNLRASIARHGLLGCARILQPKPLWWFNFGLAAVLASGNVEFVQWVVGSSAASLNGATISFAVDSGSVPLLRWLREEGATFTPALTRSAAKGGHLEALRWLVALGYPVDERDVLAAASGGHNHVLAYLVDEGAPLTSDALLRAAARGHLSTVRFMLQHECPVDEAQVATHACRSRDDRVLRWWVDEGRSWSPVDCAAAAAEHVNPAAARFVHARSGEVSPRLLRIAVCRADLDVARYAVDLGLPVAWNDLLFCVQRNHFALVSLLLDACPSLAPDLCTFVEHDSAAHAPTVTSAMRDFCKAWTADHEKK